MNLTDFPWRIEAAAYTNEHGTITKINARLLAPLISLQEDMYEVHNDDRRLSAAGLAMATKIAAELVAHLFLELASRTDLGYTTSEEPLREIQQMIDRAIKSQKAVGEIR
jgi:hypothetical protein